MLFALLLALGTAHVAPRAASWDEAARAVFDPAWTLPEELALAKGEPGLHIDLDVALARLVALVVEPSGADPGAPRCFGDVVAASGGRDRAGNEALFLRVERAQPELWNAMVPFARELLLDFGLRARRWEPERDRDDDGLLFARPLTLAGVRTAPWKDHDGSRLVQQAAALIRADAATLKHIENDFTRYPGRPGTSYESIAPVPGARGSA